MKRKTEDNQVSVDIRPAPQSASPNDTHRVETSSNQKAPPKVHTCMAGAEGWCVYSTAGSLMMTCSSPRWRPQLPQNDSTRGPRWLYTCPALPITSISPVSVARSFERSTALPAARRRKMPRQSAVRAQTSPNSLSPAQGSMLRRTRAETTASAASVELRAVSEGALSIPTSSSGTPSRAEGASGGCPVLTTLGGAVLAACSVVGAVARWMA